MICEVLAKGRLGKHFKIEFKLDIPKGKDEINTEVVMRAILEISMH